MACQHLLLLVLVAAAVPMAAMAKQWVVGDEKGWTQKFDYATWAKQKDFQVGDTLLFNYPKGHNVVKVDENGFKSCRAEAGKDQPMSSGKDTVTLDSPGKKYFICAVEKHCEKGGQKLAIEVKPASPGSRKEESAPTGAPAGSKDEKEKDKPSSSSQAPSGGSDSSPPSSSSPGGAPSGSEEHSAAFKSGYQMSLAALVATVGVFIF